MRRYLCGVKNGCTGGNIETPKGMMKGHPTSTEAFKCKCRSLLRQGYIQSGSREFSLNDEPILVLSKKTHFGGVIRGGKTEKSSSRGAFMLRHGGTIIGG